MTLYLCGHFIVFQTNTINTLTPRPSGTPLPLSLVKERGRGDRGDEVRCH
jgi:hypothetical protein